MKRMKKRNKRLVILLSLIIFFLFTVMVNADEKEYYTVVSEDNEVVFKTGNVVSVGDFYINEANNKFKIIEVDHDERKAIASFEKKVELVEEDNQALTLSPIFLADSDNKMVAIYNTHTGESYKPTSGTDSKPGSGDIIDIAAQFANKLEERGVNVVHDQSRHDPHDGGAYERSRRTAEQLAEKSPDVILDIHRDGVPDPEEYTTEIDGAAASQIKFVIGRQNPQMESNDQFARYYKQVADEKYPGLVKGIHYANGKYNQDLHPRALLIEKGTYTQSKELVEGSIDKSADTFVEMLGRLEGQGDAGGGSNLARNFLLLLIFVFGGGFLLLVANEKGLKGAVAKIKNFFDFA